MARTNNLGDFLTDVAESIRLKRGITTKIACSDYDKEIEAIETGKKPTLQVKEIAPMTRAQMVTSDEGYDGLARVEIGAVTSSIDLDIISANIREGINILGVTGSMKEGVNPEGILDITSNGTYDVTNYKGATVNVGEKPTTKGVVINNVDSDGYATDISIIGLETIPDYYMGGNVSYYEGNNMTNFLLEHLSTISSPDAKSVNKYAFGKLFVENFYLPELIEAKANSFNNCMFTNFYAPKLKILEKYSFSGCKRITDLSCFPAIESLGDNAFAGCTGLKTINLPSTLSVIGVNAFNGCTAVDNIIFPSSIHTISDRAFQSCSGLKTVDIPATVTTLGTYMFNQCTSLENVTLRGDYTSIPTNAFAKCSKLAKVCLPGVTTVPTIDSYVFNNSGIASKIGYVYVPDDLVDSFKTASVWKNYATQIKPLSELTE